jgi:hypothetical protein
VTSEQRTVITSKSEQFLGESRNAGQFIMLFADLRTFLIQQRNPNILIFYVSYSWAVPGYTVTTGLAVTTATYVSPAPGYVAPYPLLY